MGTARSNSTVFDSHPPPQEATAGKPWGSTERGATLYVRCPNSAHVVRHLLRPLHPFRSSGLE